jgi:hypothetical protein
MEGTDDEQVEKDDNSLEVRIKINFKKRKIIIRRV